MFGGRLKEQYCERVIEERRLNDYYWMRKIWRSKISPQADNDALTACNLLKDASQWIAVSLEIRFFT